MHRIVKVPIRYCSKLRVPDAGVQKNPQKNPPMSAQFNELMLTKTKKIVVQAALSPSRPPVKKLTYNNSPHVGSATNRNAL